MLIYSALPPWAQALIQVAGQIVALCTVLAIVIRTLGLVPAAFGATGVGAGFQKVADAIDHFGFAWKAALVKLGILSADGKAKVPVVPAFIMGASILLVVGWFGALSCTPARTAAAERAASDLAQCAITTYEQNPGISPEGMAAACIGLAAEDALKIIVAQKKLKGAPAPCGSGK